MEGWFIISYVGGGYDFMKRVLKFVSFEFAAQQIYFLILPLLLFSVTVVVIQK